MNRIFEISGISKQRFHQWLDRISRRKEEQMQLLPIVKQIRADHPRLSSREIYFMLKPQTMGRDSFEAFCFSNGLKVEVVKSKYKTTDRLGLIRFPNLLLSAQELTGVNQVWVSDITYFFIGAGVCYLTFITDLYSRKIVGYTASKTLRTEDTTLPALRMALKNRDINLNSELIFHSDGGGQYYCKEFLQLTSHYGMRNSMGKCAYDNPHAERINGTIKNDYLIPYQLESFEELKIKLKKAVDLYNNERPHKSLKRLTPKNFEELTKGSLITMKWQVNTKTRTITEKKVNISLETLTKTVNVF